MRIAATVAIVTLFAMPIAASAQTPSTGSGQATDIQSQMITLLQQIVQLQTTLIASLTNQIASLQQQIANLAPPVSDQLTTRHICTIVTPPTCSTTMSVTYDSYNCVTSYFCKPSTNTTTTGAPCIYNGQTYAEGATATFGVCPNNNNYNGPPFGGACSNPFLHICHNGQWVSGTQTTGASCTWINGQVVPSGTILKIRTCADDPSIACTGTVAISSQYCVNGTFQACYLGGTNNACPTGAPVVLTNK